MKRILCFILTLVVLASFATVVSAKEIVFTLTAAEDYEGTTPKTEFNAGETVYLMMNTNSGYKGISALFSANDKVFELAMFEGAEDASGGNYTGIPVMNPNGKENCFSFTAATTASRPGAMTGAYVGLKIKDNAPSGTYDIVCTGVFDQATAGADNTYSSNTVSIKVNGTSSVKTITKTEDAIVNNATALKDKETDVEIGGAAGFAFTIPAGVTLDDNMIWSLTTADGKLYSEKINAGLSTLGEGSPVKVAATFVTGTHKGADAANKEITAVNGIFKAGEDFYFTDAADAKNQAAAE